MDSVETIDQSYPLKSTSSEKCIEIVADEKAIVLFTKDEGSSKLSIERLPAVESKVPKESLEWADDTNIEVKVPVCCTSTESQMMRITQSIEPKHVSQKSLGMENEIISDAGIIMACTETLGATPLECAKDSLLKEK